MVWLGLPWHVLGVLTEAGTAGVLVGTAVAAAVLLTAVLALTVPRRVVAGTDPLVTRRVLREQAGRTGIPRHRDPDASGRPRPRAPTAAPAAA